MGKSPILPATLPELLRTSDRNSYAYFERAIISRENNAITAQDYKGTTHIPAASIATLMLGPGTSITQQAILLLAESGTCVIWVGEQGVRYYAHGRGLSTSTRLLEKQAELVSNSQKRIEVARAMYRMRFPNEDVSKSTMQQLRGKEGSRVKKIYAQYAKTHHVKWDGRIYNETDWDDSSEINRALSVATSCLYGVVYSALISIGCSPSLGFVHTGHIRSFVFDIADLYKTETAIPIAFGTALSVEMNLETVVRTRMRDTMHRLDIMKRVITDVQNLFDMKSTDDTNLLPTKLLWDESQGQVSGGTSYSGGSA